MRSGNIVIMQSYYTFVPRRSPSTICHTAMYRIRARLTPVDALRQYNDTGHIAHTPTPPVAASKPIASTRREHAMPSLPKKSVRIAPDTTLSKNERLEALHSARIVLDSVSTDWVFTPPPPPGQPSKFALQRSGSLGSWRPNAASSPLATSRTGDSDSEDAGSDSSLDLDLDLEDSVGASSYRRALTPPPKPKRVKQRGAGTSREGVWRRREDDSDVDAANIVKRESESGQYPFESPDDVPTPEKLRERVKREMEAEMAWNDGLRLFVARRDAWTGAVGDEVPVRESRFKDNPLTNLVTPQAYPQIYRKVVLEGATPPVPIALPHMINALVEGWQCDDMWPPKPSRPEPSMRKKTGGGIKKFMGIS
ncbi:unnamed protein product [Tuber melanosporum]|uniref:(Perigord truffle) hypothetical protein n=1 Tax=Tuber melanosporum (strain Mel28) TaxID=656061 RepID=D5GDK1_TUBMM|nr:uncharacterized protein GSTUM_00001056001 [Tuber melanosporum]CAZ82594.1 unnamed protein product [Tuber melanosporum]